jgi:hypothetical protein
MARPIIHFNSFHGSVAPGQYEVASGTFDMDGKEIEISLPIPQQRTGEAAADTYRRELKSIRDAIDDMIANPHGIRV